MSYSFIRPLLSALLVGFIAISATSNAATLSSKNTSALKVNSRPAVTAKVKGKKAHLVSMAKPPISKSASFISNEKKPAKKGKK
ncbi:MAG: hypothetical protein K2X01_02345 [Cyanobacteria bacterium]|nr:hypothetical protein [Cyanobacteriota bacterium]